MQMTPQNEGILRESRLRAGHWQVGGSCKCRNSVNCLCLLPGGNVHSSVEMFVPPPRSRLHLWRRTVPGPWLATQPWQSQSKAAWTLETHRAIAHINQKIRMVATTDAVKHGCEVDVVVNNGVWQKVCYRRKFTLLCVADLCHIVGCGTTRTLEDTVKGGASIFN